MASDGVDGGAPAKRQDAIKLAKGSKWEELRRLVDADPAAAQQVDSYGMLPLHWACTEPQSIGEGVLLALLKAHPQGARSANTADMLPLHIAIKAQARIEWLQALLASYPDAVMRKAPTGENAVLLARKARLPDRSLNLLEEMYHHVCDKLGLPDELEEADAMRAAPPVAVSMVAAQQQQQQQQLQQQQYASQRGSGGYQQSASMSSASTVSMRRTSSTDSMRMRTLSDNEFFQTHYMSTTSSANGNLSISSSAGKFSSSSTASALTPVANLPSQRQHAVMAGRGGVVSLPPRWMNAPNCHICALKFGTFKKRHHCRNCGQSICSDHSAREKMKLPHYGLSDRHRVCTVCHDLLRNTRRQQQHQNFQQRVPAAQLQPQPLPMRRSDEAQRSPMQSNGSQQLERHVSAPARHNTSEVSGTGDYRVVHDQVALLQQQVSKLMEEKEEAQRQLRMQAEMLEEALDPDRLTNMSNGRSTDVRSSSGSSVGGQRRDRLNSYPLKLPATATSAGASTSEEQQYYQQQQYQQMQHTSSGSSLRGQTGMYQTGRSSNRSVTSNGSFRVAREIDIDSPSFDEQAPTFSYQQQPPAPVPAFATSRTTGSPSRPLEDAFTNLSFVESNYEDSDDEAVGVRRKNTQLEQRQVPRPTDLSDFHDADADVEVEVDIVGDESADEYVVDEEVDEDEDDEEQRPEVTVLLHLGHTMMEKGSYSAAAQAFARAVEICPTDAQLHALLGRAYYSDGNLDDAVTALTQSLDLEPSATNSTLLGKILFEKGDHEKAIAAYQRSLDMQK